MKLRIRHVQQIMILAVAFIFTLYCTGEHARDGSETLRIMTFNIRYGSAQDGENAWQNRKHLVVEVIRHFAPSILGVQEALHFQLDELKTAFPIYKQVGVGRDDGKKAGEYSAIFYNEKQCDLLDQETFWFSDTPMVPGSKSWGNNITRICTWIHLRARKSKQPFYVYNLHWDHRSQPSREQSAKLLVSKIADRTDTESPVLVLGDFNAGEDNPAFLYLLENQPVRLQDSYRQVFPHAESVGTFNGFTGMTNGPKIDAILVSEGLRVISAEIVRTNEEGRFPSDHFPVTAVVGFDR